MRRGALTVKYDPKLDGYWPDVVGVPVKEDGDDGAAGCGPNEEPAL